MAWRTICRARDYNEVGRVHPLWTKCLNVTWGMRVKSWGAVTCLSVKPI